MDDRRKTSSASAPSPRTFEQLWERYHKPLTWFVSGHLGALRNGDRAREVDDAVQEIMVKVYRSIDRFDHRRKMSTWIYSIARNHCIDIQRRARTRGRVAAPEARVELVAAPARQQPQERYLEREVHEEIDAYVDTLDADDRTMLMLRFYEDLPYEEIARTVGRPAGTVRYRIHEIKAGLKAWLEARR